MLTAFFRKLRIDPYLLALLGAVVIASVLPATGTGKDVLDRMVDGAIAALFFLYGVRLSPAQVWAGLAHWKLQTTVFATTYLLFPIVGLLTSLLLRSWLEPWLLVGFVFLAILPSTIQSSIGFTSIARGNVAAALSAASISNLAGIAITPLLASLLLTSGTHAVPTTAMRDIALQLLLPFAVGQLMRPLLGEWVFRWRELTGYFDRGCILLVVYAAFSTGAAAGIWHDLDLQSLALVLLVSSAILALMLWLTVRVSRLLGFTTADEIAIVFCGSKKSLATGIPMATVLLPAATVAFAVVPLMIFHQIQLFVCAILARRYAARTGDEAHVNSR